MARTTDSAWENKITTGGSISSSGQRSQEKYWSCPPESHANKSPNRANRMKRTPRRLSSLPRFGVVWSFIFAHVPQDEMCLASHCMRERPQFFFGTRCFSAQWLKSASCLRASQLHRPTRRPACRPLTVQPAKSVISEDFDDEVLKSKRDPARDMRKGERIAKYSHALKM